MVVEIIVVNAGENVSYNNNQFSCLVSGGTSSPKSIEYSSIDDAINENKVRNEKHQHLYLIVILFAYQGKGPFDIATVGDNDTDKSTVISCLLFELGGWNGSDSEKLKQEAQELGKESFLFTFFTERECVVTIAYKTREFCIHISIQ